MFFWSLPNVNFYDIYFECTYRVQLIFIIFSYQMKMYSIVEQPEKQPTNNKSFQHMYVNEILIFFYFDLGFELLVTFWFRTRLCIIFYLLTMIPKK